MQEIYVFWDNSNLFHSAQQVATRREGNFSASVRLHFANLMRLATVQRSVIKAVAVGSVPPSEKELWDRMEADAGIAIELYERGAQSGKEQGVDQCLQTHMLRALSDEETPKIAVLLTGDGKGYEDGIGFLADMNRMHKKGWGVEILSWDHSCKKELKTWAEKNGVFVSLDLYYHSITFIAGGRSESALSLTKRKTATPQNIKNALEEENKELREKILEIDLKKKRQKKYGQKINQRKKRC